MPSYKNCQWVSSSAGLKKTRQRLKWTQRKLQKMDVCLMWCRLSFGKKLQHCINGINVISSLTWQHTMFCIDFQNVLKFLPTSCVMDYKEHRLLHITFPLLISMTRHVQRQGSWEVINLEDFWQNHLNLLMNIQ